MAQCNSSSSVEANYNEYNNSDFYFDDNFDEILKQLDVEETVQAFLKANIRKVSTGTVRYGAFSFVLRKYFFT